MRLWTAGFCLGLGASAALSWLTPAPVYAVVLLSALGAFGTGLELGRMQR